ncbi:hypothetical protein C206_06904 [Pseudomonas putida TRO1]|uniref:Uncharacterized protein n=1 Tax=Pseudomonas putida TRO1 TaxID=1227924 RepID=A0AAD2WD36_PSEPU|nr:hypothetical protein C206_06904 [Pseudomonas putida TRO1]
MILFRCGGEGDVARDDNCVNCTEFDPLLSNIPQQFVPQMEIGVLGRANFRFSEMDVGKMKQ